MKIKKAVIPAAGFGTRTLPITKSVPKEMLPIVDKPAIQYIVEEAVASGITDILIITNRGKSAIEDYFDRSVELETILAQKNDPELEQEVNRISNLANIYFLRQKYAGGLGHAVLCAKEFVGNEPFAVLYGDDVIISETPVTKQLITAYEKFGKCVAGIKQVPKELISKYCSMKIDESDGNYHKISDMVEKPDKDQIFSLFSILGRCLLTPDIFQVLENTPKGYGGELQLTDAMKTIARKDGFIGVDFDGTRYDIGNKLGILKANIEVGLTHPQVGAELKEYLADLTKNIL